MSSKEPTFFERAKKALQTIAFNRGVRMLQKSGNAYWQGPPIWQVSAHNEKIRFFEKETAFKWAYKQNIPSSSITEVQAQYSKPEVLRWYAEQRSIGMNVGLDAQQIMTASKDSVDDMIAWFNTLQKSDTASAFSLLRLGFAANRPDVTDHLAKWAAGGPWFWFNGSNMSGNTGDVFAQSQGNESQMCLFARCLSSAALTQWLFEHQPQLKAVLLEPEKWKELQHGLKEAEPEVQCLWPWIAHDVFDINVSPLDYSRCEETLMNRLALLRSFAHDPAAQCYLSYKMMKAPNLGSFTAGQMKNPDAQAFHEKVMAVRNGKDPSIIASTALVDNLMLAVYLEQSPRDLYQHAQMVFQSNDSLRVMQEEPNIESNLFF